MLVYLSKTVIYAANAEPSADPLPRYALRNKLIFGTFTVTELESPRIFRY